MSRCALRRLFTVLMYAGAAVFLIPYVTGHLSTGILFVIGGTALTVVSGLLRCFLTEGDCAESTRLVEPDRTHTRASI